MGGVARFAFVLLVAASIIFQVVISTGTRVTFLREPSPSHVRNYLERQHEQKTWFNHDFAGFTDPAASGGTYVAPPPPPPGFSEKTVRCRQFRPLVSPSAIVWRENDAAHRRLGRHLGVLIVAPRRISTSYLSTLATTWNAELIDRVHLGDGKTSYARARDALLRWQMHDESSWAKIVLGRRPSWWSNSQVQMATVAKAMMGLAWCINPCQILYERKDRSLTFLVPPGSDRRQPLQNCSKANVSMITRDTTAGTGHGRTPGRLWVGGSPRSAPLWASFKDGGRHRGIQSAVAYATKQGHLIQGEERMRVVWFRGRGGDNSVWFEVYSVSRGAGIVGGIVFPFVRSMQRRFFREQAETMQRIVRGSP